MNTLVKKTLPKMSQQKTAAIQTEMTQACDNNEQGLLRHALYKTNNKEMSQDLVQTTFLKTLLYLKKGGRVDTMRSFLNHILSGLIIDEYRKNKVLSLDTLLEKGFEPGADESERTINMLDGKELVLLIPQLPPKYALVIRLRYLNGLSLKEMALITGQSENTVAVQAHRGVRKLRALYAGT